MSVETHRRKIVGRALLLANSSAVAVWSSSCEVKKPGSVGPVGNLIAPPFQSRLCVVPEPKTAQILVNSVPLTSTDRCLTMTSASTIIQATDPNFLKFEYELRSVPATGAFRFQMVKSELETSLCIDAFPTEKSQKITVNGLELNEFACYVLSSPNTLVKLLISQDGYKTFSETVDMKTNPYLAIQLTPL